MRHQNSVFHSVMKQVPWDAFDRLVAAHGTDWRVRRLTTKDQFVALLFGQLSGASSLREIELGLASHAARLYHLGAHPALRSTLADANAHRTSAVFADLFAEMVGRAHRGLRRKMGEAVRLIDATMLPLNGLSAAWSRFSVKSCGAKAHVIYDPDADCPLYLAVTPAKGVDVVVAKAMPIEANATYVFDLGYYDYGWWAKLDARGCRIVTRFKRNTPFTVIRERRVPKAAKAILTDRIGSLPARLARSRRNPFAKPVREIRLCIDGGKILRILTNDLNAPAQKIADLYKRRWAIELFFRWVKQTLKIRHFLGTSENAVRIQIAVALIAFLLLRMAQTAQNFAAGALAFARLVRLNLMHRRSINALTEPPQPIDRDPRQMDFPIDES
jgi:Transposase DDE domain/Domain of unknown function (DUF4372)